MVRVRLLPENRVVSIDVERIRVEELLRRLGLSVESAVVVKNGRPLLDWEEISGDEEVTVIRAVSGG